MSLPLAVYAVGAYLFLRKRPEAATGASPDLSGAIGAARENVAGGARPLGVAVQAPSVDAAALRAGATGSPSVSSVTVAPSFTSIFGTQFPSWTPPMSSLPAPLSAPSLSQPAPLMAAAASASSPWVSVDYAPRQVLGASS